MLVKGVHGRLLNIYIYIYIYINPENSLSPVSHQTIFWNAATLSIKPQGTYFNAILFEFSKAFVQENTFQNVACKMAAILSQPQCDIFLHILNVCGISWKEPIMQMHWKTHKLAPTRVTTQEVLKIPRLCAINTYPREIPCYRYR